jgi:hypothetical protein
LTTTLFHSLAVCCAWRHIKKSIFKADCFDQCAGKLPSPFEAMVIFEVRQPVSSGAGDGLISLRCLDSAGPLPSTPQCQSRD